MPINPAGQPYEPYHAANSGPYRIDQYGYRYTSPQRETAPPPAPAPRHRERPVAGAGGAGRATMHAASQRSAPFTDGDLAHRMGRELVSSRVMTQTQLNNFLNNDNTERAVRSTLTSHDVAHFKAYYRRVGRWMEGRGGSIGATSASRVAGREGGNPSGIGLKSLYNDAFNEVNRHIDSSNFSTDKAISNHLRFISTLGDEDE